MTTTSRLRPDTASGFSPVPASPPTPPKAAVAAGPRPGPAQVLPSAGPGSPPDVRVAGTSPGEGEAPATRTWTIELPAGLKVLSLNQRLHWAEERKRARELKKAAWAIALQMRVPHLNRITVVVEYQPPDRRHRDNDNIPAKSGKHLIDGIVAAGVLDDDEAPLYVADCRYKIGPIYPRGRFVLYITEVEGGQ